MYTLIAIPILSIFSPSLFIVEYNNAIPYKKNMILIVFRYWNEILITFGAFSKEDQLVT